MTIASRPGGSVRARGRRTGPACRSRPGSTTRRILLALALVATPGPCALAMSAAAARGADASPLRIGLAAEPTSVDPHALNIAANNALGWHLFDALTHVDAAARLVPGLATSWAATSPTEWVFHLRTGVHFHDGRPFEAADVMASIDRVRRLPGGQFAAFVQRIAEVSAPDAHTIRIRTTRPHAVLPLDLNSIFIISRQQVDAPGEAFDQGRAAIGTGPWRLRRFVRGESVQLDRNPDYWGGAPAWSQAELRVLTADRARMAALLGGDVDLIEAVPGADRVRLRERGRFHIEQAVSWRTLFFHLDPRSGSPGATALADPRVREALSLAIDRQAIVTRLLDGAAAPAANLVAPGVFGHVPGRLPIRHDPVRARALLAEAGLADRLSLTVAAPGNRYPGDARIAQAIAAMFERVGVHTRLVVLPISVYLPRARRGEFAVALLGWGSFSGDLALRSLLMTRDAARGYGSWNWSNYSNPAVDQRVEAALGEIDRQRGEALVREAMNIALDEHAVIPLHHLIASWALRPGLRLQARTDEFTFAHQVSRLDKDAGGVQGRGGSAEADR